MSTSLGEDRTVASCLPLVAGEMWLKLKEYGSQLCITLAVAKIVAVLVYWWISRNRPAVGAHGPQDVLVNNPGLGTLPALPHPVHQPITIDPVPWRRRLFLFQRNQSNPVLSEETIPHLEQMVNAAISRFAGPIFGGYQHPVYNSRNHSIPISRIRRYTVGAVKRLNNGTIIITTSTEEQYRDLNDHIEGWLPQLSGGLVAPQHLFSLSIDNVPTHFPYHSKRSMHFQELCRINGILRQDVWGVRWLDPREAETADSSTLVIHILNGLTMRAILMGGLRLRQGAMGLTVNRYITSLEACTWCQSFDHGSNDCKEDSVVCGLCGGAHSTATMRCCTATPKCTAPLECLHSVRHCVLCEGAHSPLDMAAWCPVRMRAVELKEEGYMTGE